MRRGITTSEFWLTLGSSISMLAGGLFGILPPTTAALVLGGVVATYIASRGFIKVKDDSGNA